MSSWISEMMARRMDIKSIKFSLHLFKSPSEVLNLCVFKTNCCEELHFCALTHFKPFNHKLACTAPVKDGVSNEQAYSTPEAEGVPSQAILDFVDALENEIPDQLHSLMIRRHGKVIAQAWWAPYQAEAPHMLYSLSKSFTSTAIGMAVDEGLISLDDPVISFFPEETPAEPSENLKAMRIRDLLRMNTGH